MPETTNGRQNGPPNGRHGVLRGLASRGGFFTDPVVGKRRCPTAQKSHIQAGFNHPSQASGLNMFHNPHISSFNMFPTLTSFLQSHFLSHFPHKSIFVSLPKPSKPGAPFGAPGPAAGSPGPRGPAAEARGVGSNGVFSSWRIFS